MPVNTKELRHDISEGEYDQNTLGDILYDCCSEIDQLRSERDEARRVATQLSFARVRYTSSEGLEIMTHDAHAKACAIVASWPAPGGES